MVLRTMTDPGHARRKRAIELQVQGTTGGRRNLRGTCERKREEETPSSEFRERNSAQNKMSKIDSLRLCRRARAVSCAEQPCEFSNNRR